jgi:sulfur carrier protein ThiS adenylyltransferase
MRNPFLDGVRGYLGEENLKKIQNVKVGIAGAGGLGSNCAQHLVRSGFKHLVLVDFDRVDYSNLNRQFYFPDQVGQLKVEALEANLKRINPCLNIRGVPGRLCKENMLQLLGECAVVVEALDDALCKRELVETFIQSNKLLVAASGIAGWGKSDEIRIRQVNDSFYVVGDMVSEAGKECPPVSPRVNIVAAKQADIVLSRVLEGDF